MKRILFILALVPTFLMAQTAQVKGFVITGNVAGLGDGTVKLTTTQQDAQVIATGTAKQGVFTLKGAVPEPGLYFLTMGSEQPQYIYLENKPIKITGNQKEIKKIKIEGSQSHRDFVEFNQTFNPIIGELNAIAATMQQEPDANKREWMMKKYDSVVNRVNEEVGKFITAKKSSYVAPFLLFITAQLNNDPILLEQRFKTLDPVIQQSEIGKSLSSYIAYNKVGSIGTDALEFTQPDVEGKPLSLSSFKGKYVLVDFWASWCKPCRQENPNVVKAYHRFKDKNFTILGVSLDQQKEQWVRAINDDQLSWSHVSDLQQWNNAVAQLYHVQSIPQNFLIDPNGKIIAKDLRGDELQRKLCELLGCN